MKFRFSFLSALLFMLAFGTLSSSAQTVGEYLYLFHRGQVVHKEKVADVDSIALENGRQDVVLYNARGQQLYTRAAAELDSISLINREPDYLTFVLSTAHQLKASLTDDIYDFTTLGEDGYICTSRLATALPDDSCVVTFEYRADAEVNDLQLFLGDPMTDARSAHAGSLPQSSEWRTFSFNLKSLRTDLSWGRRNNRLRIDFGSLSGVHLQLRHLYFRSMTDEERTEWERFDQMQKAVIPLNVSTRNQLVITFDAQTLEYSIQTTGGDPYIYTDRFKKSWPSDSCILTFDYICPQGLMDLQLFFGDPITEERSLHVGNLNASTSWTTFTYNIKEEREAWAWGLVNNQIRLDFGTTPGVSLKMRHLRLRGMTSAEREAYEAAKAHKVYKEQMAARLQNYLDATFQSAVTNVEVKTNEVTITGTTVGEGPFALVEVPPYEDLTEQTTFTYRTAIDQQEFSITLPRVLMREGYRYDRLLSRWAIVREGSDGDVLQSHARYADTVATRFEAEPGILRSQKGIGGDGLSDFAVLGAHSTAFNFTLNELISTKKSDTFSDGFSYGGKTYYISPYAVRTCDYWLTESAKNDVIVSAIVLIAPNSELSDPECEGGFYAMVDMTTPKAVNLYAAAIDFLARRYSSGEHGRIHHWIMHNEIDYQLDWTNMGEQPELRFLDRYQKSMRLVYNIVRQYDQHASVLQSHTHCWTDDSANKYPGYSARNMLEQTNLYSQLEGDYRWGVAFHPYANDLTQPEFWKNDVQVAPFRRDAPIVSFLNLEVINDWILNPTYYYKGKEKRILFFSEQGTNSPTYTDRDFQLQAAGAAWFWKKVKRLKGVDGVQWHGWRDYREEFGLRLGLVTFAEGEFADATRKPSWYVWQAANTEREDEVFAPYLEVIGIQSWDEIFHDIE